MSNRMRLKAPLQQPKEVPFNIQDWLKDGGRFVTRKDLWEFTCRLEVGKRVRGTWRSRVRRGIRRVWAYLTRSPMDVEDKFYR